MASHMAAAQQVFMFAFCSCNSMELKRSGGPEETRKLLFRSYIIIYRLFNLAKTDAEICHTPRFFFAFLIKLHYESSYAARTCDL